MNANNRLVTKDKVKDYQSFLNEVKNRITSARYEALKKVNYELIELYWDLGKMIITKQESEGWGKSVVNTLSKDLQKEFPGISGLSTQNIWRMRQFYKIYATNEKLAPLVREIGWSHNLMIMGKCKDDIEREFYIRMTRKMGWSKRILNHQIDNKSYEKMLTGQSNFDKVLPEKYKHQAILAVKDEYTFPFLDLAEEHSELELERELVKNIQNFLIEMGGQFAFIGHQYRLIVDEKEFFIDLLLYHRPLKCLFAIDLKIGEFKPGFVGKMQFYLSVLDDTEKTDDENSSIGLIICKEKNRTIVEYALKDSDKPIGVGTYTITTKLPEYLSKHLPSTERIVKLMQEI